MYRYACFASDNHIRIEVQYCSAEVVYHERCAKVHAKLHVTTFLRLVVRLLKQDGLM